MATDLEQVNRLKMLNGTDPALFVLAIYSYIEYYCKKELGEENWNNETPFFRILKDFRYQKQPTLDYVGQREVRENISSLIEGHIITNGIRHQFDPLSKEEVTAHVEQLLKFAKTFKLPNYSVLKTLDDKTLWDSRKNPEETAKELRELNQQIEKLTKESANQIDIAKYNALSRELKSLQSELEAQESSKSKISKRNDDLRRDNFEKNNRIKELEQLLAEEKKTQQYINNTLRLTNYTRTRSDYEKELLRLTPEQNQIVNMIDFGSDYLIKGSAGTGKSVVIMKLLEKLKETNKGKSDNIKFITYTKNLVKYNKYVAKLFNISSDNGMVVSLESFLWSLFSTYAERPGIYNSKDISNAVGRIDFTDCPLSKQNFKYELTKFILPNAITKKEYCEDVIERKGMLAPLKKAVREKVWEYCEMCFEILESRSTLNSDYCYYKYATAIKEEGFKFKDELLVDYLIIDEVQDLNPAKLIICKNLVKKSLIMAGDNDQSIFGLGFNWKSAGINIVGKSKILHTNFRNTNEINEIAEKYRASIVDNDFENRPLTFRVGPKPEIHQLDSANDFGSEVFKYAEMCINQLGYSPENICIIINNPSLDIKTSLQNRFREELDVDLKSIDEEDFSFEEEGVIRYTSTRTSKGLDFPVVLYVLNSTLSSFDGFDDQNKSKCNRNAIYTALTRSMDMLHIFVDKNTEEPEIRDLIDIVNNESITANEESLSCIKNESTKKVVVIKKHK